MNWTGIKNGKLIELLAENSLPAKHWECSFHNYRSRCIQKYPETTWTVASENYGDSQRTIFEKTNYSESGL